MVSSVSEALVPMPIPPAEARRVERFVAFEEAGRRLVFAVDSTAFFEADDPAWALLDRLRKSSILRRSELVAELAAAFGAEEAEATVLAFEKLDILVPADRPRVTVDAKPIQARPLSSLVLHVSHDCNLRCGYCYADFGRYGGAQGMMSPELALRHVDGLFDQLAVGQDVYLTFFGGEPLMNMPVVFAAHAHAKARAQREGRRISFGITTNATLLTEELATFFKNEHFTVTVSIDGPPDINDRLRPLHGGGGSYERILERVRTSKVKAVARVTLTRQATDVARIVRHLVEAGFVSVGVSPVASGNARFDFDGDDLNKVLAGMRVLSDDFVEWAKRGEVHPFSNLKTLVEQVAAGEPRGMPCGAASALTAADNKGDLYACHRLVGEADFKIGNVETGIDAGKRLKLLTEMHPRDRAPCQYCWARYLCGGGCHHIAWLHSQRSEAPWQISDRFCDFLRDWYRLGLTTYARLAEEAPAIFAKLGGPRSACGQPEGL